MKNFKTIITAIAISLCTVFTINASEKKPLTSKVQLRTEIASILGKKIPVEIKKDLKTTLSFMINNKNEVVVISVDSKNTSLNTFVKNKLNYKKVSVKGLKKGNIYKMPINIKTK